MAIELSPPHGYSKRQQKYRTNIQGHLDAKICDCQCMIDNNDKNGAEHQELSAKEHMAGDQRTKM